MLSQIKSLLMLLKDMLFGFTHPSPRPPLEDVLFFSTPDRKRNCSTPDHLYRNCYVVPREEGR